MQTIYKENQARYNFYLKKKQARLLLKMLTITLGSTLLLLLVLEEMIFFSLRSTTDTMWPTLDRGERLYVNKLAYGVQKPFHFGVKKHRYFSYRQPHRGDIVAIVHPWQQAINIGSRMMRVPVFFASLGFIRLYPRAIILTRVVGLPGERILIKDKKVFINKKELMPTTWKYFYKDKHILNSEQDSYRDFIEEVFVPENRVFVLNDNWNVTTDSRLYGVVHIDRIEGRVIYLSPRSKKDNQK